MKTSGKGTWKKRIDKHAKTQFIEKVLLSYNICVPIIYRMIIQKE